MKKVFCFLFFSNEFRHKPIPYPPTRVIRITGLSTLKTRVRQLQIDLIQQLQVK